MDPKKDQNQYAFWGNQRWQIRDKVNQRHLCSSLSCLYQNTDVPRTLDPVLYLRVWSTILSTLRLPPDQVSGVDRLQKFFRMDLTHRTRLFTSYLSLHFPCLMYLVLETQKFFVSYKLLRDFLQPHRSDCFVHFLCTVHSDRTYFTYNKSNMRRYQLWICRKFLSFRSL